MDKADTLDTAKKVRKLEKIVINTQLTKKPQFNFKYQLAAQQHANDLVSLQIDPSQRRIEFQKYLELFGYKPESTIIQVHIAGFFNKRQLDSRETERRMESAKRYGGTTFILVGRTHDPSIMDNLIQPKRQNPYQRSPGYVGYLWKKKDRQNRPPHEILPLDFTPTHISYPSDWKRLFATKGFMIALHVPSYFAKKKNEIMRILYRIGKKSDAVDVRKEWSFLRDIEESLKITNQSQNKSQAELGLVELLKLRLTNGEISKEEFDKLRKILHL
ncbi:MAG TPA: hypothetical protein VFT71_01165 [Candidatus Nitrosocosmicus sp.]|nr:hypothetical protein [Candidatus Nitrosocosmicus sp.]